MTAALTTYTALTLTTYLRRTIGLSLCEQARAAGLCDRTVRRWARGCRAQPDALAAYLRWLTSEGGVAARLDQDSAGRRSSSMARGLRPYVVAAREGGFWSFVVLLLDGRQLVLCRDGVADEAVQTYEDLRSGLLRAAQEWADELYSDDDLTAEDMQMTREKTQKVITHPRGLRARYETSTAELTSATIRVLMLADVARRGELEESRMSEAVRALDDAAAELNAAAARLWEGE